MVASLSLVACGSRLTKAEISRERIRLTRVISAEVTKREKAHAQAAEPTRDQANYRAEFAIGRYLYWVWFSGDSRAKTKSNFERGIATYYQHAKQQKS